MTDPEPYGNPVYLVPTTGPGPGGFSAKVGWSHADQTYEYTVWWTDKAMSDPGYLEEHMPDNYGRPIVTLPDLVALSWNYIDWLHPDCITVLRRLRDDPWITRSEEKVLEEWKDDTQARSIRDLMQVAFHPELHAEEFRRELAEVEAERRQQGRAARQAEMWRGRRSARQ